MNQPINLSCSAAAAALGPLDHYWSRVIGAERCYAALRTDWIEQLRWTHQELGVKYARVYGAFAREMFTYQEHDGIVDPSFQYVDLAFDAILGAGVKPFVTLAFMAPDLATSADNPSDVWFGIGSTPPADTAKWAALVSATIRHWIDRYGAEEVRTWLFEVWNEPNLDAFWVGTRQEYFEFYAATAAAVKAVDPALRVGGPTTINFVPDARFAGETEDTSVHLRSEDLADLTSWDWRPVWVEEFLDYCAARDLPVDFVSTHPYPTDWALDSHGTGAFQSREVGALNKDLNRLRDTVARSAYPDAELHLSEWSSSAGYRDHTHDYPQAATYVVKSYLENLGLANSVAYWTFSDIFEQGGAGDAPLHGGFGLITRWGNPKPTYRAFEMLNGLGDELLARTTGAVVSREAGTGKVSAVVYHYPDEVARTVPPSMDAAGVGRSIAEATLAQGTERDLSLAIDGLSPSSRFAVTSIDAVAGNIVAAWQAMGSPLNLSRLQSEALTEASRPRQEFVQADAQGSLRLERRLSPWTVLALRQL
ncbi:MAG: hypothetical protein LBE08_13150 [Bifidobacteriaceae bacterium]|nr:hypothetical protein [Bifidobacteriaceae bacterium]